MGFLFIWRVYSWVHIGKNTVPLKVFSKWLKYLQSIWHGYFCQLLKIDPSIWFSIGCSAFLFLFTYTALHDSMNFMIPAVHTSWTVGNHACWKGFARFVLWTRHTSLKEQIALSDVFNYTQTPSYICSSERSSLTAKYRTALNHFHIVFYHLNILTCVCEEDNSLVALMNRVQLQ